MPSNHDKGAGGGGDGKGGGMGDGVGPAQPPSTLEGASFCNTCTFAFMSVG